MNKQAHLKHDIITFNSADRDVTTYPDSNSYEVDVHITPNVVNLRLGSFESHSVPQNTIRSAVNDTVHFSQGFIVGGNLDTTLTDGSQVYENEMRFEVTDTSSNVNVYSIHLPPHDLEAACYHNNTSSGGIIVYCDGAHGLYNAHSTRAYSGPPVWLLSSNQGEFLLADASGLQNNVVVLGATSLFIPDADVVTDGASGTFEGAIVHTTPWSVQDTLNLLNNKGSEITSGRWALGATFSSGAFTLSVRTHHPSTSVRLQYSTNSSYRGLGHILGNPSKSMTQVDRNTPWLWTCTSTTRPSSFEASLPPGIYDVADLGSNLTERMNALDFANPRAYDANAIQFGVMNAVGTMYGVRVAVGKFSIATFTQALKDALEATVSPSYTWTVSFSRTTRKWTISNSGGTPFVLVFSYTAEPGSSWATAGTPPAIGSAALVHAARILGFYPSSSVMSEPGGTLTSVTESSLIQEIATPRFYNAQTSILTQTALDTYQSPHFSTVVSTRDPSTRRIAVGGRNPHVVDITVADSSNVSLNWSHGAVDVSAGVTLLGVAPTGYSIAPPLPFQVGQMVRLGHTSNETSVIGQVYDLSDTGGSGKIRVDQGAWTTFLDADTVPTTSIVAMPFDPPKQDLFSSSLARDRLGLATDLTHVESFAELPGQWNVEHHPSFLLQLEPVGVHSHTSDALFVQDQHTITPAFARIPVRSTGVVHINSLGSQEMSHNPGFTLRRVRVNLLNPDGTAYETNKTNHHISLVLTHH